MCVNFCELIIFCKTQKNTPPPPSGLCFLKHNDKQKLNTVKYIKNTDNTLTITNHLHVTIVSNSKWNMRIVLLRVICSENFCPKQLQKTSSAFVEQWRRLCYAMHGSKNIVFMSWHIYINIPRPILKLHTLFAVR